jgi:two-component system, OmpR family, heavy metal sensor histidine kinase CusS
MKKGLSIGLRLTLSYLIIFAVAQLIFGVGMWFILRHNLYDIADDTLEGQIDDVKRFLEAQRRDASVAKLREEVTETYVLEHSGDYLQIQDEQGDWIYRSSFLEQHNLPALTASQWQKASYENRRVGGRSFRFLSDRVEVYGRRFIVQTAVPEGDILRTLRLFKQYLLIFAGLILLAASAVGYWLSRRALAPVDALTRTARSISGANLSSRLERLNTGDEVQRLSDTLNEMLARIETAFLRVSQFTADASHELRTPISLIRTEAEIALRKSRDPAEYQEALSHILHEAERTSALVEKLLSLARADAGRESLDMRRLDLGDTVREVAHDWHHVMATHQLRFTESLAARDVCIAGDKTAVSRLLNILLDNAVRYTPSTGSVELALETKDETAVIAVRDSGIGISNEDRLRIFERFYRADKARSRELGGAGLGLAIAQWIVEQHRGSITVVSSPGKGSEFIVELPMSPANR